LALIELMTASLELVGEPAQEKNALPLRGSAIIYARVD
jgi:hypothetical protein